MPRLWFTFDGTRVREPRSMKYVNVMHKCKYNNNTVSIIKSKKTLTPYKNVRNEDTSLFNKCVSHWNNGKSFITGAVATGVAILSTAVLAKRYSNRIPENYTPTGISCVNYLKKHNIKTSDAFQNNDCEIIPSDSDSIKETINGILHKLTNLESKCDDVYELKTGRKITRGAIGMKYVKDNKFIKIFYSHQYYTFKHEKEMYITLAKCSVDVKLTPKLLDYGFCIYENSVIYVLILEGMDGDLSDYNKAYGSPPLDNYETYGDGGSKYLLLPQVLQIFDDFYPILENADKCKYLNNDPNIGSFLYKHDSTGNAQWLLTDFDRSNIHRTVTSNTSQVALRLERLLQIPSIDSKGNEIGLYKQLSWRRDTFLYQIMKDKKKQLTEDEVLELNKYPILLQYKKLNMFDELLLFLNKYVDPDTHEVISLT
jgi:hypothetical protein